MKTMNIKKLIILILFIILFFLCFSYLLIFKSLKNYFFKLEKENAKIVITNCEKYFQNKLTQLYNLTKDWAAQDKLIFYERKKRKRIC